MAVSRKVDLQRWLWELEEAEVAEEAEEVEELAESLTEPLSKGEVSRSLSSRLGVALPAISSGSIVTHCSKKRRQVIPSRGPDADETDHLEMIKLYLSARGNQDDLAGWSTRTKMRVVGASVDTPNARVLCLNRRDGKTRACASGIWMAHAT